MKTVTFDELVTTIRELTVEGRPSIGRPSIVGVDGFGGSGKTTLVVRLVKELGDSAIVAMDDFVVKKAIDDSSWEHVWDRNRLARQVLEPLAHGHRSAYEPLDWESGGFGAPIDLPDARYVFIEGITSLHPTLRHFYDSSVWVNTPIEIAMNRGQARDAGNENERGWKQWAQNDLHYLSETRPDQFADAVIENA
ncbi:uridine kinase family protein [Subtercola endophyticus]|uniref:uridine kinase family protein n=1 Tax=Subtercola endophyticus TaxID=2895559 RepID=UPI001E477F68|nr:hypothetical protein [Subtercola endophyticus]UFS59444.1 hypothetical protein LQ955_01185 [Subtercola endophyticus]